MQKITLTAIATAALFALSGTAATAAAAQDSTPICSKTVTDNCMQREGHAAPAHRAPTKHHAGSKHRTAGKHRTAAKHHRKAPHRKMAHKAAPAAAPKAPAPKK